MVKDIGKELWRSQLHPSYKAIGKFFLILGLFIILLPDAVFLIIFIGEGGSRILCLVFLYTQIITGIFATGVAWVACQYFGSYLIIYETGLKVRKPYRLFRHKYIPFNLISKIRLKPIKKRSNGWRVPWIVTGGKFFPLLPRRIPKSSEDHEVNELFIFLKSRGRTTITDQWAYRTEDALDQILPHLTKSDSTGFCQNCHISMARTMCMGCGFAICSFCEENNYLLSPKTACIICHYEKANKIVLRSFLLALCPIFLLIIGLLNSNSNILLVITDSVLQAHPIFIFYVTCHLFISFFLLPYGFAHLISNIFRVKRIKRLQIKKSYERFHLLILSGIIIASFELVFIIQVFCSNYSEWIVFGIIEICYLLIVTYFLFQKSHIGKNTKF
jgi:hypothetical protein